MSMESFLRACELAEKRRDKIHPPKPKPESFVRSAEEALEIVFPPTYRSLLKKYGTFHFGGWEIFGLCKEDFLNSCIPDAIWLTLNERKNWGFPHHLIIISDTGDGFWYVLDSSKPNAEGEYPVAIYGHQGQYEKIYEDFGDFLLEEVVNWTLRDDEEELEKEERPSSDRSFFSRT